MNNNGNTNKNIIPIITVKNIASYTLIKIL